MTNFKTSIVTLITTFIVTMNAQAQVTDYLNVPGPVKLLDKTYNLAWSAHPSDNYFKQEYIPAGENPEKFNKMVMVEVLTGNALPAQLAAAKIEELKKLKATNPVVNYQVYEKDKEVLLDFLVSANSADGKTILVLERNVYRYIQYKDKSGKTGVILFAGAERAYQNDVESYLTSLKGKRNELLSAVGSYPLPAITIK